MAWHRLLQRAAAGLAVDGDHGIRTQGWKNRTNPAPERRFEFVRIDHAEQPAKSVMRRNAGFQLEVAAQPVQLLFRPQLDFHEGVGSDQHRIDRHNQQFDQVVFDLARLSWVGDRYEYVRQPQLAFRLHGSPQKDKRLQINPL